MNIDKSRTREILIEVVEKAKNDESFKQALLKNPIEAINELTGSSFRFPENKRLVFVDDETNKTANSDNVYYINISTFGNLEDMELSEEQLEAIAGGTEDVIPDLPWPILLPWN